VLEHGAAIASSGSVFNRSLQSVVVRPEFRQVFRLKNILDRLRPTAEAHGSTEQTGPTSDLYEHSDLSRIHVLRETKIDDNIRRSRLLERCQNAIRAGVYVVVSQSFYVSGGGNDYSVFDLLHRECSAIVIRHDWSFVHLFGSVDAGFLEQGILDFDFFVSSTSDAPNVSIGAVRAELHIQRFLSSRRSLIRFHRCL